MRSRYIPIAGLVLLLGACADQASQKATTTHITNGVAAAEVSLTAAQTLALHYTTLPRCGSQGATKICSDPATVRKILDLDKKAYAAVQMARKNEALLSVAVQAIGAFSAAVPK